MGNKHIWVRSHQRGSWVWVEVYCHNPAQAYSKSGDYLLGQLIVHKSDWGLLTAIAELVDIPLQDQHYGLEAPGAETVQGTNKDRKTKAE